MSWSGDQSATDIRVLASASVQPEESTVELPQIARPSFVSTATLDEQTWRHTGWWSTRVRVAQALAQNDEPTRRIDAYRNCGSTAWVQQHPTEPDVYRIACDRCHDRFCLPCANEKARLGSASVYARIKGKPHRFLTLTLKTDGEPLATSLDRLLKAFRRLRQRQFWKRHVTGGLALLEIKWIPETLRWHPHLHVIAEGRYMEKRAIGREWYAVTGDSWIVDIRLIRDEKHAACYIAKYATKGYDSSATATIALAREAIAAMKGRRLVITFGSWRGWKLDDTEPDAPWINVDRLTVMILRAKEGDAEAHWILKHVTFPISDRNPPTDPRPPPHVKPPPGQPSPAFPKSSGFANGDWLAPDPVY